MYVFFSFFFKYFNTNQSCYLFHNKFDPGDLTAG